MCAGSWMAWPSCRMSDLGIFVSPGKKFPPRGWWLWGICCVQGLWWVSCCVYFLATQNSPNLIFLNSSVAKWLENWSWIILSGASQFSSFTQTSQEIPKSELCQSGSLRNFRNLEIVLICACICLPWFFFIHHPFNYLGFVSWAAQLLLVFNHLQ